jgi:UDP-N-acetylglucosamine 4-epimerase
MRRNTRRSAHKRRRTHRMKRAQRGGQGYAGKRVLVTGGAGFIGSNLVDALLRDGAFVRVLDSLRNTKGDDRNLQDALKSPTFEFLRGDIRNPEDCRQACDSIDIVFHEAALVSVPESIEKPLENNDINITGTMNMLEAAAKAGVKRFVYASSAATYGSLPEVPKVETMPRDYPSPYALAKGVDEDYAKLWARVPLLSDPGASNSSRMTTIGLRYFNVFGPRQDPTSAYSGVISRFTHLIKNGMDITVNGDGLQTRDFVHVKDVVQANMLAGLHPLSDGESRVYNVGTGNRVTLLELIDTMKKIIGKDVDVLFGPERVGDIRHSYSNISLIQEELQYSPGVSLEMGLRNLLLGEAV